jgi:hypothetical protein
LTVHSSRRGSQLASRFGRAAKVAGREPAKNSGKNADSQLTDRQKTVSKLWLVKSGRIIFRAGSMTALANI